MPHSERNAPFLRIHVEHYAFNLVANIDQLGGVLHALGPRHFADVHQALNTLLQFDKGAVVGHADDTTLHMCAHGIAVRGIQPRVGRELLEAERDALLFFIEFENFHLDLVADVNQVAGVGQTSP